MFGSSSSLPPLVGGGGGLVCMSVFNSDLQSDHFDSKQSTDSVDLQLTCHPSFSIITLAFVSSEVRRLLLDLTLMVALTQGMFPFFLERTDDVLAPRLSVAFRRFVRLGSFLACWRQANVTPIPKGPQSSSVANYRPISVTSVLSKVFGPLVSVRLGRFMERNGVLPTTQFAYQKGQVHVTHFCACPIHCKVYWRVRRKQGSYRLISAQSLIGSTVRELSISSVRWVLEVLCCLY